ncbi:WD40 repeat protein [Catenulispora sp. GAS73]|uniref:WD40 repeat domain-containing protein n=1 Tax=Catenulispora sp. GAS73 TaxID=3156269 RepID=UPI0035161BC4
MTAGTIIEASLWQNRIDDAPVAVAATAGLIAVAGAEGECTVLDAGTGERLASGHMDGGLLSAAFAPDGSALAVCGPSGYVLWRAGGEATRSVGAGWAGSDVRLHRFDRAGWSCGAAWTADSTRVAVAAGRTIVVHGADGEQLWRTDEAPSTVTGLTWIRDGREVAASAYGGVYRYAPHSAAPTGHLAYPGSHLAIAATPDTKWICTGNQDRSVHIWRTRDASELEMAGYPDKVTRLAFDPTGRWLANNGAPDITVWDFSGKGPGGTSPRQLRGHDAVTDLAWRPGGAGILASAGAEGGVCVWKPVTGIPGRSRRPRQRFELGAPATAVAWLDADRIVAADADGGIACFTVSL